MATDPMYQWMNNTGTGPIAVPIREVGKRLRQGWTKMQEPGSKTPVKTVKPKPKE